MKLFDLAKDFFFSSDEDDDEINDTPSYEEERRPEKVTSSRSSSVSSSPAPPPATMSSPSTYSGTTPQEREEATAEANRRNRVVNIQATAQLQVVLVKPSAFTDAKQIADHLIGKKQLFSILKQLHLKIREE